MAQTALTRAAQCLNQRRYEEAINLAHQERIVEGISLAEHLRWSTILAYGLFCRKESAVAIKLPTKNGKFGDLWSLDDSSNPSYFPTKILASSLPFFAGDRDTTFDRLYYIRYRSIVQLKKATTEVEERLEFNRFVYLTHLISELHVNIKQWIEALTLLKDILERRPEDINTLSRMGRISLMIGNPETAEEYFTIVECADSRESPLVLCNGGLLAMVRGNYSLARHLFESACNALVGHHIFRPAEGPSSHTSDSPTAASPSIVTGAQARHSRKPILEPTPSALASCVNNFSIACLYSSDPSFAVDALGGLLQSTFPAAPSHGASGGVGYIDSAKETNYRAPTSEHHCLIDPVIIHNLTFLYGLEPDTERRVAKLKNWVSSHYNQDSSLMKYTHPDV